MSDGGYDPTFCPGAAYWTCAFSPAFTAPTEVIELSAPIETAATTETSAVEASATIVTSAAIETSTAQLNGDPSFDPDVVVAAIFNSEAFWEANAAGLLPPGEFPVAFVQDALSRPDPLGDLRTNDPRLDLDVQAVTDTGATAAFLIVGIGIVAVAARRVSRKSERTSKA
jgi:hypothetical protein